MAKKPTIDKSNPAYSFISRPAEEEPTEQPRASKAETAPTGYKLNPLYVEKKTKRVQLVFQPSLYDKVKAAAAADGKSVNDYIHSLLEDTLKGE